MNTYTTSLAVATSFFVATAPLAPSAFLDRVGQSTQHSIQQIRERAEKIRESANVPSEVETKRQEIEARIAERQNNVREKLSGRRATTCKEREARINQGLTKRVDAAQRHFDKFKSVQDKLLAYVADNQLTVRNGQALQIIMVESEIDARAAIEAARSSSFSCDATDARSPGKIVREQVAAQKEALKIYLASIKDYAAAVKAAVAERTEQEGSSNE